MTTLGKYELHEQLGKGGFGTVYRATDTTLGREVALKILHPQLMVEETFIERFKKEARTLAGFDHSGIVTLFEMGETDGRVYLSMRYLPGGNLQQLLQKGPLSYSQSLKILTQVCEALQGAHEKGLVHRDIKPANILFDGKGNPVISDFGLARVVQISSSSASSSISVVGTPAYRAPELWRGKPPASPATDVYSLGCILVEMITGKILFDGETPDEILTQHLIDGPTLPEYLPEGCPSIFKTTIIKSLEKNPAKRQQNADELMVNLLLSERSESLITIPKNSSETQIVFPISSEFTNGVENNQDRQLILPVDMISENELRYEIAPNVSMEFLRIPSGNFIMGSDLKVDPAAHHDEEPQHTVFLDEFWIGKFPVTGYQYNAFVLQTHRYSDWGRSKILDWNNIPITKISWNDALEFCNWCSSQKISVTLPTEAQWEKSARGTDGRIYPWGSEIPNEENANYYGGRGTIAPVGDFPKGASPYGVLDLVGNVWEWVLDWYSDAYYSESSKENPTGPENGHFRVIRGGSWGYNINSIRSANRGQSDPLDRLNSIGFRCVMNTSEILAFSIQQS